MMSNKLDEGGWNCKAIISRLCKLQSEVASYQGSGEHAADCFCGEGGFWDLDNYSDKTEFSGWKNDGKALEFIEETVRKALKEATCDTQET